MYEPTIDVPADFKGVELTCLHAYGSPRFPRSSTLTEPLFDVEMRRGSSDRWGHVARKLGVVWFYCKSAKFLGPHWYELRAQPPHAAVWALHHWRSWVPVLDDSPEYRLSIGPPTLELAKTETFSLEECEDQIRSGMQFTPRCGPYADWQL